MPSDDDPSTLEETEASEWTEASEGSPWSRRMPTSVAGLAVGILACTLVIALCLAAMAAAVGLLTGR